jgi:hypothetical protein
MTYRTNRIRSFAAALAVIAGVGGISLAATPAQAGSEETWRYVTYGAGAATVYMGAKGKTLPAVVGAAGTYIAYKKWQDEKNERQRDDRWDRRDDRRRSDRRDDRRDDFKRRSRDRDRDRIQDRIDDAKGGVLGDILNRR